MKLIYASLLHSADVIKIEEVERGDDTSRSSCTFVITRANTISRVMAAT